MDVTQSAIRVEQFKRWAARACWNSLPLFKLADFTTEQRVAMHKRLQERLDVANLERWPATAVDRETAALLICLQGYAVQCPVCGDWVLYDGKEWTITKAAFSLGCNRCRNKNRAKKRQIQRGKTKLEPHND